MEDGSLEQQEKSFDATTSKGREGGLFQLCMKAIRSDHRSGNRMRSILVVAGLFTDKTVYRDVVSLFYVVTKEVETKLQNIDADKDAIAGKLRSLGYHFTPGYEKDMPTLYSAGSNQSWQASVEHHARKNSAANKYVEKIRSMKSGEELAGALFVLWGALIIGGGAMASRRVLSLYGPDATNVFQSVTGPGRAERRQKFIEVWDSLVTDPDSKEFTAIVQSTQECMSLNNTILVSIQIKPWWYKYVIASAVAVVALLLRVLRRKVLG